MVTVRASRQRGGWVCEVDVEADGKQTHHTVTVAPGDLERWGKGGGTDSEDAEDLVARSFDFLLEREPPGSILPRFDLSVIRRYFPEYDSQFKR